MKSLLWVLMLAGVTLTGMAPVFADEGNVILHPGTVSGSVSITARQITEITVYAIDTVKAYSGTVTAYAPAATNSINYVLTVEGGRDYYVMAEARVSAADNIYALFPVAGPVTVPVGGDVPLNLSMNPGIISGTISTGSSTNMIQSYDIYAYVTVPEFGSSYGSSSWAYSLNVPGDVGRDYTLLVPPGATCSVQAYIYIDGVEYYFYDYGVTAPAAGVTKDRDYTIAVTAASISGTARLQGIDVISAWMYGNASSPSRSRSSSIPNVSTGLYTLEVDAGDWRLRPYFYFNLPGDLSGLTGSLSVPYSTAMNVKAGDHLTGVDFIVNPGFIPGTLNLWGANTNFENARVAAYTSDYSGYVQSEVVPGTGEFLMVCSPGDWKPGYYQYLYFDYPDDPDPALYSYVYQYLGSADVRTVLAGQTTSSVDLTFGTITVRRYFYVAGGGTLSQPYITAIRHESPFSQAYGYGSYSPTTEGQAIVTLLLPGTYTIEAFANVSGSDTEFGSMDVTVDEGDVVVIGGSDRPTVQLTNPTNDETVCGKKVTVEGTITDDHGIASITINGEDATFDLVESGAEGKTYHFSHEVILDLGENTITIVVKDTDHTEPVVLEMNVVSEDCPKPCPVVTLTSPTNGQTVNSNTIVVEGTATDDVGVASVKINGQDVAFDIVGDPPDGTKNVHFSRQIGLDCGENTITIVVSDLDGAEPTTVTTTVTSTDCTIPCLIDIYPNRVPNRVYLKINYTIYVAVLGTEGFAVKDLDSSTVRFGRTGTEASPVLAPMILDINGDGFKDAYYGFRTFDCGFKAGDTLGWLTAQTTAGKAVKGSDSVSITP